MLVDCRHWGSDSEGSRFLAKTSLRVNENNVSQVMESKIVQLVPRIEFDNTILYAPEFT